MARKFALGEDSHAVILHYGKIKAGLYHYITPPMILALVLMITIISLGFEKIKTYFMHGPVLNGLMLIVITTGIVMAIRSNLAIFHVARLAKRVEEIQDRGIATHEEVHQLRKNVEGKANLLSMAIFSTALEKMEGTGKLLISDPDARLIKSKFGSRVSHMRSKVNYFCGILVMLGLIGTFWGLLGTITSVGQAMTKISENFATQSSAGASAGNVDMGGFLQSISKPLEGMGVGFSASLFGLTGSLFLGFFNFLCAHAQNKFIEHFGRWIDDCVPSVNASFVEKMKGATVPSTDELKAWMAGFIFLSNKTHQQIAELVTALAASSQVATARLEETQKLFANQSKVLQAISSGNKRMKAIHASVHAAALEIKSMTQAFRSVPEGIGKLSATIADNMRSQQKAADAQLAHIGELFEHIQAHSVSLASAADAQTQFLTDSHVGAHSQPSTVDMREVAELRTSIATLLGQMHGKNEDALLAMFLKNGTGGAKSIDGLFANPN